MTAPMRTLCGRGGEQRPSGGEPAPIRRCARPPQNGAGAFAGAACSSQRSAAQEREQDSRDEAVENARRRKVRQGWREIRGDDGYSKMIMMRCVQRATA